MTTLTLTYTRIEYDLTDTPVSITPVVQTLTYLGDLTSLSYSVDAFGFASFDPLSRSAVFSNGEDPLDFDQVVGEVSWSTNTTSGTTVGLVLFRDIPTGRIDYFVSLGGDAIPVTTAQEYITSGFMFTSLPSIAPSPLAPGDNLLGAVPEGDPFFGNISLSEDDTFFFDGTGGILGGGSGNDTWIGSGNFDAVDYRGLSGAIDAHIGRGVVKKDGIGRDSLSAVEDMRGTALDDRIVGDAGTGGNYLYGEGGNDIVRGLAGADFLFGGDGDDKLFGGTGRDRLEGGDGEDRLEGGDDDDILLGGGARDVMRGEGGADDMYGGLGGDRMLGGTGNDNIEGQAGDDDLFGQGGEDVLIGGDGVDRLDGGRDADVLIGGAGNDFLFGGAGADIFLFEPIEDMGLDRIKDWQDGIDLIDLRAFGFADFDAVADLARDTASGLRIDLGADSTGDLRILFVENLLKADFDAGDVALTF